METKIILDFLIELKENNNREWFHLNKTKYENAKEAMIRLTQNLIVGVQHFDSTLGHPEPNDCIFRIFRDVRFSKNKEPYKINMGGFLVMGGRKSGNAGYYLHLEPGNSFCGGGLHMPEPKALKAVRDEISYSGAELVSIIESASFKQHFSQIEGESLVRPPKGFDPESNYIDLIKMKSFTVFKELDDEFLSSENFVDQIIPIFKTMKPFISFLNKPLKD